MTGPSTRNATGRKKYANYMAMHDSLAEAKEWVPKAEHEDIRCYVEVLPDEITLTREEFRALVRNPRTGLGLLFNQAAGLEEKLFGPLLTEGSEPAETEGK